MHFNEGVLVDLIPLMPQGTNSTLFTECCHVAIFDGEKCCPWCKREVVGADADSGHERHKIRWRNATRHWKR